MGRPRKYASPEELLAVGNKFFDECDEHDKPYTITGLALALGFTSRQDLINYAGYTEDFHDAIRGLKLRCEDFAASVALSKPNQAGAIFVLKNHGWSDQQRLEVSGPGGGPLQTEVKITFVKPGEPAEGEE